MTEERRTSPPEPEAGEPTSPPLGWEDFWNGARESRGGGRASRPAPDLTPLIDLFASLRRAVPVELQEQIVALQRELLLTLRAFIDWYLERLDEPRRELEIEDIPIE